METANFIDALNRKTMSVSVSEYDAIVHEGLHEAERRAVESVLDHVKDKSILDIGVGAGRTVQALASISADYTGVDYVQEMVRHCRQRFPGVKFEQADARAMTQFGDSSFDLIVFSCNGISMVDHIGRLSILDEVRRLLRPGGVFIFSTCNRSSRQHGELFEFPPFQFSWHPAKLVFRAARFLNDLSVRLINRARYKRHEIYSEEYSILNDRCHHYSTMLYFISVEEQRKQLLQKGFGPAIDVYDLAGSLVGDTDDGTVTFLVRA